MDIFFTGMMWTAPELMRLGKEAPVRGTQKGDVYSFAIICQELLTRSGPFDMSYYHLEPKGNVHESLTNKNKLIFFPTIAFYKS